MSWSITIICQDDAHFDVHEGERYANGLVFDEMLAEIARLTLNVAPRYMQTPETRLDTLERMSARRREREAMTP